MSLLLDEWIVIGGATTSESVSAGPLRAPRLPSVARIALFVLAFTLAMLVVLPAFVYFGWRRSGADGIAAAVVAAAICWVSAGVSLVLLGVSVRKGQLLVGVLGGMLLRMAPPLIACFVFVSNQNVMGEGVLGDGGSLARAGAGGMTLVYYLIALSIETLLSVRLAASALPGKKPGQKLGKKRDDTSSGEKSTKQSAAATSSI